MARHIPKPFTVEFRKSSRKPVAAAAAVTADPTITSDPDDQPAVSWPGFDEPSGPELAAEPETVEPVPAPGRILPALDEPAPASENIEASEPPARTRTKRKPAKAKTSAPEGTPKEASPADLLEPAAGRAGGEPVIPADIEPPEDIADASAARAVAATLMLRQGRKRLSSDEFTRGERWKARLPAAVHRRSGKGLRRPDLHRP